MQRQKMQQQQPPRPLFLAAAAAFAVMSLTSLAVQVTAGDRQGSSRRLAGAQQPAAGAGGGFRSSCGTSEQVARRIGQCMAPTFDILEGRVAMPTGDADLVDNCERMASSEKCVRAAARECLSGIQKTAVNTVPSAIKRFRSAECKSPETRAKYKAVGSCCVKRAKGMQAVYRNHTAIVQSIRDLPGLSPEEKVLKLCCLLVSLDREIERNFIGECPKETPVILSIVHAITDDARNTLCTNPRCPSPLLRTMPTGLKQQQNFIEPISQLLFMLNTDA